MSLAYGQRVQRKPQDSEVAVTVHTERRWHREQRLGLGSEDLLGLPGHARTGRPQYVQDCNSFQTFGQPSLISKTLSLTEMWLQTLCPLSAHWFNGWEC